MKLGFLILAHDNPANTARLIRVLLASGAAVCLHYDLKGGDAPLIEIKERLGSLADQLILPKRVKVNWGEWSIVEATLNGLGALLDAAQDLDYVHLMSGADYPIRPISEFRAFLERQHGVDFIESHAVSRRQWVKDGLSRERYQYRHYFNFKAHPKLFHWCWKAQAALRMRKKPPRGLAIHMGSQWWTLTAETCRHVLARGKTREVAQFFRHSWIPDEMFVQTLAAQVERKHSNRHLTLYQFNDYGVPIVYYDSHASYLSRQPFFFARKLSPFAGKLRDELDLIVNGEKPAKHFHDWQIGSPTEEYEQYKTLHRKGLPGRRVPGQVTPGHLGELAWNSRKYLVVLGTSTFELEQAAAVLSQIPGLVCDGFLFAAHEVGFAGDKPVLAGYSRHATPARDHAPATFIADVVNSRPNKMTCFLMRRQEAPKVLWDIIRWDVNAVIVILQGGVLRAYGDVHGHVRRLAFDDNGADQVVLTAARVSQFEKEFQVWSDDIPPKQNVATASFHLIDVLEPQLPRRLIDAAVEAGVEVKQANSILTAYRAGRKRPPQIEVPLAVSLLSRGQSTVSRRRLLTEVLAPSKAPYLALVGTLREEADEMATRLAAQGHFIYWEDQAGPIRELLQEILRQEPEHGRPPLVLICGADDISMIEAIALDPDARILELKMDGGIIHPATRNGMTDPSRSITGEMRSAWDDLTARLNGAAGPVLTVNLSEPGWAKNAAEFVSRNLPGLSTHAAVIEQAFAMSYPSGSGDQRLARDDA